MQSRRYANNPRSVRSGDRPNHPFAQQQLTLYCGRKTEEKPLSTLALDRPIISRWRGGGFRRCLPHVDRDDFWVGLWLFAVRAGYRLGHKCGYGLLRPEKRHLDPQGMDGASLRRLICLLDLPLAQ